MNYIYRLFKIFLPGCEPLLPFLEVGEAEGLDVASACKPVVYLVVVSGENLYVGAVRQVFLAVCEMAVGLVVEFRNVNR